VVIGGLENEHVAPCGGIIVDSNNIFLNSNYPKFKKCLSPVKVIITILSQPSVCFQA
jgi:hypothetical protein